MYLILIAANKHVRFLIYKMCVVCKKVPGNNTVPAHTYVRT